MTQVLGKFSVVYFFAVKNEILPDSAPLHEISFSVFLFSGACVYKGKIYHQNDRWQDGCKLTCECLDARRGQYKCTYT